MAHGHDDHGHAPETLAADKTPKVASSSSLWVALILIGLFIAAVNFISVSGTPEEGGHGGGGHTKEGTVMPTTEATSNQTMSGETGLGAAATDTTQHHGSVAPAEGMHSEGH